MGLARAADDANVVTPDRPSRTACPPTPSPPPPTAGSSAPPVSDNADKNRPAVAPHGPKKSLSKILVVGGVTLVAAAAAGYYFLLAPGSEPLSPPPAKASTPKPTPSDTLNKIAATPAQSINKAKDVIAARRATDEQGIDAVLESEASTSDPASTKKQPPAAAPIRATSQLSPGVVATTTVANISGNASPAFSTWVANAKISGVFQGTPPRALINGRTVRLGQEVDIALGISFHALDAAAKTIVFRDQSGATGSRRY